MIFLTGEDYVIDAQVDLVIICLRTVGIGFHKIDVADFADGLLYGMDKRVVVELTLISAYRRIYQHVILCVRRNNGARCEQQYYLIFLSISEDTFYVVNDFFSKSDGFVDDFNSAF